LDVLEQFYEADDTDRQNYIRQEKNVENIKNCLRDSVLEVS
jgi:hypothetical protein